MNLIIVDHSVYKYGPVQRGSHDGSDVLMHQEKLQQRQAPLFSPNSYSLALDSGYKYWNEKSFFTMTTVSHLKRCLLV